MGETVFVNCAFCLERLSQISGLWLWAPGAGAASGSDSFPGREQQHGHTTFPHLCLGRRQPGSGPPHCWLSFACPGDLHQSRLMPFFTFLSSSLSTCQLTCINQPLPMPAQRRPREGNVYVPSLGGSEKNAGLGSTVLARAKYTA